MAARLPLVMLATTLVIGTACGRTAPNSQYTTETNTSTTRAAVPSPAPASTAAPLADHLSGRFVPDVNGPPKPPPAMLEIGLRGSAVRLGGSLYSSDWGPKLQTRPSTPVPWLRGSAQEDRLIRTAHSAGLWFITVVPPDSVTVHTYAKVAADTGEPTGPALMTYECTRFQPPRCTYAQESSVVTRVTGISREVLDGNYITVFAMWHASAAQVRAGSAPERTATWLYRGLRPGPAE